MSDVSQILQQIERGDPLAADTLLPVVYDELRQLAHALLQHEAPGQTLQPTALVHEAYLRLVGEDGCGQDWANRRHFYAAAAEAMRRILIENARRKRRIRHGGKFRREELRDIPREPASSQDDLLALDEALQKLQHTDPQAAELVRFRYFAGLPVVDAADLMRISERSAARLWAYAKAWLYHEIHCS